MSYQNPPPHPPDDTAGGATRENLPAGRWLKDRRRFEEVRRIKLEKGDPERRDIFAVVEIALGGAVGVLAGIFVLPMNPPFVGPVLFVAVFLALGILGRFSGLLARERKLRRLEARGLAADSSAVA